MFFLGNIPVLATVAEIMTLLKRELNQEGINLLHDVIVPSNKGQDIKFTCPKHKHGQESKPSAGITQVNKNKGVPAGTWSCFACKSHGDITELISFCFGKNDGGLFGKKWILDRFCDYEIENRDGFFHKLGREKAPSVKEPISYITEEELDSYRYTHSYMYKRHLTDETINTFDIGYDPNFKLREDLSPIECITFPVKDQNGNCLFVARRSIEGKLFNYPHEVDKPLVYLWEVEHLFPDTKELYIVESILNALALIQYGFPAIAILGTGSASQYKLLKDLPYRVYHIATDNDEAGNYGAIKLYKALRRSKLLDRYIIDTPKKDINDYGGLSKKDFMRHFIKGNFI